MPSPLECSLKDDRHAAAPESSEVSSITWQNAITLVLDDMESFSDFISCHGARHVTSERIERYPALLDRNLAAAGICQVLHLLANSGDTRTIVAARDELVRRYLADKRAYIAQQAGFSARHLLAGA